VCGRFARWSPVEKVASCFGAVVQEGLSESSELQTGTNISPFGAPVLGLVACEISLEKRRVIGSFAWGVVLGSEKSRPVRLINARAETLASKPTWREAFAHSRVIVPADGFYEWPPRPSEMPARARARRSPWLFRPRQGGLLAMGALCLETSEPRGTQLAQRSLVIVTTPANKEVALIHERMPLLIAQEDLDIWLDTETTSLKRVTELLHPASEGLLVKEEFLPGAPAPAA
jgi:putative SOS response-associated peptidase YedK